jgi:hypothetical protein
MNMDLAVVGVLIGVLLLLAAIGAWMHVAYRRGWRVLRAIQIAETAVDVARRYGGDAGPVEAVAQRLRDLKWEIGIEDTVLAPPVAEDRVARPQRGAHTAIGEDGAVLIEWYADHYRLGLSIEPEASEICWSEASWPCRMTDGSGYLRDGVAPFRDRLAKLLEQEEE